MLMWLTACDIDISSTNSDGTSRPEATKQKEGSYYLNLFLLEGLKRGADLDTTIAPIKGLIIQTVPLPDSIEGKCYPEQISPRKVQINSLHVNELTDLQKELIYFHEFGHCLLNRPHLNTTLPNGEWASLMYDGIAPNPVGKSLDYRGAKKTYYLDELFDEATGVPGWAMDNNKF